MSNSNSSIFRLNLASNIDTNKSSNLRDGHVRDGLRSATRERNQPTQNFNQIPSNSIYNRNIEPIYNSNPQGILHFIDNNKRQIPGGHHSIDTQIGHVNTSMPTHGSIQYDQNNPNHPSNHGFSEQIFSSNGHQTLPAPVKTATSDLLKRNTLQFKGRASIDSLRRIYSDQYSQYAQRATQNNLARTARLNAIEQIQERTASVENYNQLTGVNDYITQSPSMSDSRVLQNRFMSDSQSIQNPSTSDSRNIQNPSTSDSRNIQNTSASDSRVLQNTSASDSRVLQNPSMSDSRATQNPSTSESRVLQNPSMSDSRNIQNLSTSDSRVLQNPSTSDSRVLQNPSMSDSRVLQNPSMSDSRATQNPSMSDLRNIQNPSMSDSRNIQSLSTSDSRVLQNPGMSDSRVTQPIKDISQLISNAARINNEAGILFQDKYDHYIALKNIAAVFQPETEQLPAAVKCITSNGPNTYQPNSLINSNIGEQSEIVNRDTIPYQIPGTIQLSPILLHRNRGVIKNHNVDKGILNNAARVAVPNSQLPEANIVTNDITKPVLLQSITSQYIAQEVTLTSSKNDSKLAAERAMALILEERQKCFADGVFRKQSLSANQHSNHKSHTSYSDILNLMAVYEFLSGIGQQILRRCDKFDSFDALISTILNSGSEYEVLAGVYSAYLIALEVKNAKKLCLVQFNVHKYFEKIKKIELCEAFKANDIHRISPGMHCRALDILTNELMGMARDASSTMRWAYSGIEMSRNFWQTLVRDLAQKIDQHNSDSTEPLAILNAQLLNDTLKLETLQEEIRVSNIFRSKFNCRMSKYFLGTDRNGSGYWIIKPKDSNDECIGLIIEHNYANLQADHWFSQISDPENLKTHLSIFRDGDEQEKILECKIISAIGSANSSNFPSKSFQIWTDRIFNWTPIEGVLISGHDLFFIEALEIQFLKLKKIGEQENYRINPVLITDRVSFDCSKAALQLWFKECLPSRNFTRRQKALELITTFSCLYAWFVDISQSLQSLFANITDKKQDLALAQAQNELRFDQNMKKRDNKINAQDIDWQNSRPSRKIRKVKDVYSPNSNEVSLTDIISGSNTSNGIILTNESFSRRASRSITSSRSTNSSKISLNCNLKEKSPRPFTQFSQPNEDDQTIDELTITQKAILSDKIQIFTDSESDEDYINTKSSLITFLSDSDDDLTANKVVQRKVGSARVEITKSKQDSIEFVSDGSEDELESSPSGKLGNVGVKFKPFVIDMPRLV